MATLDQLTININVNTEELDSAQQKFAQFQSSLEKLITSESMFSSLSAKADNLSPSVQDAVDAVSSGFNEMLELAKGFNQDMEEVISTGLVSTMKEAFKKIGDSWEEMLDRMRGGVKAFIGSIISYKHPKQFVWLLSLH